MIALVCLVYVLAMTAANFSVGYFGPGSMPVNAFVLIGLDLALRDWLHVRLPPWAMGVLIAVAGALTWATNAAPTTIAVASSMAFVLASCADWAVFSAMRRFAYLPRSNVSNVAGALVDSIAFPLLAGFGYEWFLALFGAKVAGGYLWSLGFSRWRVA